MPHKHTRLKAADKSLYELPPTTRAKPLPVTRPGKTTAAKTDFAKKGSLKRKRSNKDTTGDDTPRAFARLMAFHTHGIKPRSGLDNGVVRSTKRKRVDPASENPARSTAPPAGDTSNLRIKPGERIAEFSARVDATLPVSGLVGRGTKGAKDLPGVKKPQTKMERKHHRMYKEWREVEAKREEMLEEQREGAEDAGVDGFGATLVENRLKKGKKQKGDNDDDEDPWAAVGRETQSANSLAGLVGLHDVVQAPPQFTKMPKAKFRVMNGAKVDVSDVPVSAGSLRRREELGQARRSVVEGYRRMMRAKRDTGAT